MSLHIYHRHIVKTEYTKQAGSHMKREYMSTIRWNDLKRYNNGTRGDCKLLSKDEKMTVNTKGGPYLKNLMPLLADPGHGNSVGEMGQWGEEKVYGGWTGGERLGRRGQHGKGDRPVWLPREKGRGKGKGSVNPQILSAGQTHCILPGTGGGMTGLSHTPIHHTSTTSYPHSQERGESDGWWERFSRCSCS